MLTLLFAPLLLPAQELARDSVHALNTVTVTATRKNSKLLSVPYAVSSVSRKELDDFQYRTLPEALQGITGVFVQKTNHGGGSALATSIAEFKFCDH